MPKELPEIRYINTNDKVNGNNMIIDSDNSLYSIPLYKGIEYFSNFESYNNFIKNTERIIRGSDRYKKYIHYLKKTIGLNTCQVLSGVEICEDSKVEIEMHHGPIFTLYDYCAIILEYYIIKGWKISTFRIADTVLDEHFKNRVQVVMLSKTIHEEVHNREIFINYKQAWGDLNAFVKKYGSALSDEYKEKMNRYIDRSLIYDSDDYGILKLSNTLYSL